SYGGEMLIRVYFFSLPFIGILLAHAFIKPFRRLGVTSFAVLALACVALVPVSLVARYGNERLDYFRPAEIGAVARLYDIAPRGSLLIAGAEQTPWKYRDYTSYHYRYVTKLPAWHQVESGRGMKDLIRSLMIMMEGDGVHPSFLLLTSGESDYIDQLGRAPAGTLVKLQRNLLRSPKLEVLYRN